MKKAKKLKKDISEYIHPVSAMKLIVTALFYGRSGTGKTTIGASFPKPLLVVDIGEKGTDSISDVDDVHVIRIRNWKQLEEIYWGLKNGDLEFKTVMIDAIHAMQDLAIQEAKRLNGKDEEDQMSRRDFGTASGLMKQWIFNYRDLEEEEINVIFICHDRLRRGDEEEQNDNEIKPEVGPMLMPSVAGPVCGAVKVVGHTFIRESVVKSKKLGKKPKREIQYCMRLGPHTYYTTKIRSPKTRQVPYFISDPTYEKIVEVMKGLEEDSESRPAKKIRRLS